MPMVQVGIPQEISSFLYGIRRSNGFQETFLRMGMPIKKGLPQNIEEPNQEGRSIPMEINDNKITPLLQGSGHLVEEVDRPI